MRTFVAVPLPAECRKVLEEIQSRLRSSGADVRWVAPSSIHITLKFLGEIDPALVPRLAEALRSESAMQTKFSLRLQGLGGFPNLGSPRVIWCGLEGEVRQLQQLQARVEQACASLGFAPEGRGFQPHLTLGRVQGKRNLQHLLDYIRMGFAEVCAIQVDTYHVYKSTLSPRGAIYGVLETIRLRSELPGTA
jgi:2'-5' RNA ligase